MGPVNHVRISVQISWVFTMIDFTAALLSDCAIGCMRWMVFSRAKMFSLGLFTTLKIQMGQGKSCSH